MKKYCFDVTKTITLQTMVMVNATTLKEANDVVQRAIEEGIIEFDDLLNAEEEEIEYNINSDSAKDDYSFDEETFSDFGIKYLNI